MLGIRCVIIFLNLIASVSGALYPTFPIASTTWSGGRAECVTWVDDGSPPHLQDLGKMDLELFVNGKTHVATLATNVSPDSKFQKFKVLPSWGPDSSHYHVRFVSHQPPRTFYTADFTLRDMDYNSTTAFFSAAAVSKDKEKQKAQENAQGKAKSEHIPSGTTTTSVSLYTPVMTLVLPDTTILSTLAPTTPRPTPTTPASPLAAAAVTTATATTATPAVVIQDQPEGPPERGGPGIGGRRKSSSATSTRRVDMEKVKFRVVFILWPVLIGLSMAL